MKNTRDHNKPPNFNPASAFDWSREEPINDFSSGRGSPEYFLKGDAFKIYYLMVLSGIPAWKASRILFNLKYAERRASIVQVRNELVNFLRKVLAKAVNDPILYQRLKALATKKDLDVFEDIRKELKPVLSESAISAILKQLMMLQKDKQTSKQLATHIINYCEEVMGTGSTINIGGSDAPQIAGLPPDQPPVNRPLNIIRRTTSLEKQQKTKSKKDQGNKDEYNKSIKNVR